MVPKVILIAIATALACLPSVRSADPAPTKPLSIRLDTGVLVAPPGSISLSDPAFGGTLPVGGLPGNVAAAAQFGYVAYAAEEASAVNSAIAGRVPSAATQNFFSVYDGVNKVFTRNPTCVFRWPSYLSCWNSANADGTGGNRGCVTMVTPTQGVTNNHFQQPYQVGVVHYFVGTDGVSYPLTVASSVQIGMTDIQLVKFASAAPSAVGFAKVLEPGVPADVFPPGTPLLSTNQAKQAIITQFLEVADGYVLVNPATGPLAPWTQNPPAVTGDSDSPTFVLLNGQPILLCTYFSGGSGPSYADNAAAINAALAPGTNLTVLPLNTLGTAAALNAGSAPGDVPILNVNGQIDPGLIPVGNGGDSSGITYVEQTWDCTTNVTINPSTTVLRLTTGTPSTAGHFITLPSSPANGQALEIVVPASTGTVPTDPTSGGPIHFLVSPANLVIFADTAYTRVYRLIAGTGGWAVDKSLARQNEDATFTSLSTPAADFTGDVVFEDGATIHGTQGNAFGFSVLGVNGAAQFTPVPLAAGQSARLNAAGTALEAYTPGGGTFPFAGLVNSPSAGGTPAAATPAQTSAALTGRIDVGISATAGTLSFDGSTPGDASGTVKAGQLQIAGGDGHGLVYGPVGNLGGMIGFSVHSYAVFESNVYIGGTLATLGAPLNINAAVNVTGNLTASGTAGTAAGTFSTAPASPVEGMTKAFTDSTTAVWGATITGGGTNHVLGYYDGTNWTVTAK